MYALFTRFRVAADAPSHEDLLLNKMKFIRSVLPEAREDVDTNAHARDFINAAQAFQASLMTACSLPRSLPDGLLGEYRGARKAARQSEEGHQALMRAEIRMTYSSDLTRTLCQQMMNAGMTYIRSVPALSVKLADDSQQRWGRIKPQALAR